MKSNSFFNRNSADNDTFIFTCEDGVIFKVNQKIKLFSKLFHNLIQDYSSDTKGKKLENIFSKDIHLLLNFLLIIKYDENTINFKKSISTSHIDEVKNHLLNNNPEFKTFYEDLNSSNIIEYIKLADFYDVPQLENIINFKLFEVFSSKENIKLFFEKEKVNDSDLILDEEREKYLRDKYLNYVEREIEILSDNEVEQLLERELQK
jgi:hypothetical protein